MIETLLYRTYSAWLLFGWRDSAVHSRIAGISSKKDPSFNAHSLQCKRTLYAFFPCKIKRWKTCLKLFYIEYRVHGYFLCESTVLYIAGSLRYLRINNSLHCKRTLYALFPCKKIRWKTWLKLYYIEHRVHGYFLGAGTVLYIAGSLRYLRIKHPSFDAHFVHWKRILHALFPCKIHLLIV